MNIHDHWGMCGGAYPVSKHLGSKQEDLEFEDSFIIIVNWLSKKQTKTKKKQNKNPQYNDVSI